MGAALWVTTAGRAGIAAPCGVHAWESSTQRVAAIQGALGAGPWPRERLIALGLTRRQLERDVSAGRLIRLRPGLYAAPPVAPVAPVARESRRGPASAPDGRAAHEVLARFGGGAALSHATAARVRGLWQPLPLDDRVHVTLPGASVRRDALVSVHGSPLELHEVSLVTGARTTSIERTAVDLARSRTFRQALVPLDSAVRLLVVGSLPSYQARAVLRDPEMSDAVALARAALRAAVERASGWRGVAVVRACLDHVDPRSESPYESWSRGILIQARLAPSAVSLVVRGASGATYVADLAWEEHGVLGEVDGLRKYGTDASAIRASLAAERRRQRDLEDAGWVLVRWTAGEPPERITARVRRALKG